MSDEGNDGAHPRADMPEPSEVEALRARAEAAEDVLRGLASYLGVGGYNADTVDAAVFDRKIRDGIDMAQAPLLAGWRRYNKLRGIGAAPNGTLHLEKGLVMVSTNLDAWLDKYIETGLPPAPAHAVEFPRPILPDTHKTDEASR